MRLKVPVLQGDIDEGIPGDCQNCPLALAIKRRLKQRFPAYKWTVSVGFMGFGAFGVRGSEGGSLYFSGEGYQQQTDFIRSVDRDRNAVPQTFTLDFRRIKR